ncbi:helix-turn-helix transcriptional regulator [Faecalibacterium taiwanense]
MHYGLVGLQARIQLAAAQLRFGQRAEARAALAAALLDAVQDDFWVLFVEQYPALAPLLEEEDWAACEPRLGPFVARILPAGRAFAVRLGLPAPAPELPLTDRDRELARLVAGRCTNKEIAAALYLSEGTVKQYINQLYAKLDMGGDPRTRRARLAEWYQKNAPRN